MNVCSYWERLKRQPRKCKRLWQEEKGRVLDAKQGVSTQASWGRAWNHPVRGRAFGPRQSRWALEPGDT